VTPLSAHFSLEEATVSQTAARLGIDNTPTAEIIRNMKDAALQLEFVRMHLNSNAMHISSWFRCPELNKAIGSKSTSDHLTGYAIDFTCPSYGPPKELVRTIAKSKLKFSQLILEYDSWVHISFKGQHRQLLVIDKDGTRPWVA
jgi:zinc D-Ala-D-Ala carboxypeptidase